MYCSDLQSSRGFLGVLRPDVEVDFQKEDPNRQTVGPKRQYQVSMWQKTRSLFQGSDGVGTTWGMIQWTLGGVGPPKNRWNMFKVWVFMFFHQLELELSFLNSRQPSLARLDSWGLSLWVKWGAPHPIGHEVG